MDGSIARGFQEVIAQAWHQIGVRQMYAGWKLSFQFGIFVQYLAVVAAAGLLIIIDRANRRTNLLTALLVPYIVLNLPDLILGYVRTDIGAWIGFAALVSRLFFPTYTPPHFELPATLILVLLTTPSLLIKCRFMWPGEIVSIGIGFYLLYEHIVHAGGAKKAFSQRVATTIGIMLLFVAPGWQLASRANLVSLYVLLGMTVMMSPLLLLFALPESQPDEHKD